MMRKAETTLRPLPRDHTAERNPSRPRISGRLSLGERVKNAASGSAAHHGVGD